MTWLTGHSLEVVPWRWCAHLRFFSHGEMKQQLRSTLRTFCFLVEITEVMNDHQDICKSGRWELRVWHLGSCTAHGQEQNTINLCGSVSWHQLSLIMTDSLLEVILKCHTIFRDWSTSEKYLISVFTMVY